MIGRLLGWEPEPILSRAGRWRGSPDRVHPEGAVDAPLTLLLAPREPAARRSLQALVGPLAVRLRRDVAVAWLDGPPDELLAGVAPRVGRGASRLVALPLALGPTGAIDRGLDRAIGTLRQRWPALRIHRGAPPAADDVARMLGDRARAAMRRARPRPPRPADTAVVLVGAGDANPGANAELARVARLVCEAHRVIDVGYAFLELTSPSVGEIVARWARLGARAVVVVPYAVLGGRMQRRLTAAARAARTSRTSVLVAPPLASHRALVGALVRRYLDALGADAASVDPALLQTFRGAHDHAGETVDLPARMAAMLPPRYRDTGAAVGSDPMGAAALECDPDGAVAWDRMWQGFCELALAGGPPHRGVLLEPATREAVLAEPARYAAVIRELERGLRLVTGLDVLTDAPPGWLGMACPSEDMAIWLMRAVVVENVLARREGTVLYLPAGPDFALGGEIKNIVTAVAKTYHYWLEHARG
jgi:sirohydrochlorin cobaltochelatase